MKINQIYSLEEGILLLQQEAKKKPISLGEILRILPGKGQAFALIILCLPFCQPFQIPGLSVPFGLAIALLGVGHAFRKHIWLPQKVLSHRISAEKLQKIIDKALVLVRKMKRWIHPRLGGIFQARYMRVVNGLIIACAGLLLALPLPIPFSNLTAAWSILLLSVGLLEEDGFFMLMGYLAFLVTLAFLVIVVFSIKQVF